MRAIILAAGKGERLKGITVYTPKPMIEFRGKPVLQYNIELCRKFGIEEIYVNLHHLPEKITEYFGEGKNFGVKIKYSFEEKILGTAGAVAKIAKEYWKVNEFKSESDKVVQNQSPFFVIYGDQVSNFDLSLLNKKYDEQYAVDKNCMGIIAFHHREDVEHSGVAEFDKRNRIIKFIEKPRAGETESHWVNAGVYYLNPSILNYITSEFSDFGKQLFPHLLSNRYSLYGVCEHKDVHVFDTPEMYANTLKKIS